jgi:hypothetical protein
MNNGPIASRIIFLSDLRHVAVGEKVRFLGWFVLRKLHSHAVDLILMPVGAV